MEKVLLKIFTLGDVKVQGYSETTFIKKKWNGLETRANNFIVTFVVYSSQENNKVFFLLTSVIGSYIIEVLLLSIKNIYIDTKEFNKLKVKIITV